jgi:hypothetical protein
MSPIRPTARSLVVCEAILTDPDDPNRVTLVHVINSIRAVGTPPYPARHPQLSVFAQLTECRGAGDVWIEVRSADTDRSAFRSPPRRVQFQNTPLVLHGLRFRLLDCPFPHAGAYWVQLWYNEAVIAQTLIELR